MSVSIISAYAHNHNEAFFTISSTDTSVCVEAEFPWTARNALLLFKPELENSKERTDFELAFQEYIIQNLQLSSGSEVLPFIDIREMTNSGHSHQNNYLIRFQGNEFNLIKNTLLFNYSNKQINYHTFKQSSKDITFTTSKKESSYQIPSNSFTSYLVLALFVLGVIIIVLLAFIKQLRKQASKVSP